ncbi:MAG: hypothetical protein WAM77_24400, partial [Xanthobacteraceae bacterium]
MTALLLAASPALAQDSATIPLHKRPDQSGFANFIAVSVGGGSAGDVLLDTGSTGLRIRAAAVGPDVRLTNIPVTYSYTSGNVLTGVIGYAKVSFPGANPAVATKAEIAIHVVQQITCKAEKPDCPGWKPTEMGVMGAAYLPFAVFNPLAQLDGNLAGGFIVAADDIARPNIAPHIIVGLTDQNTAGFSFAPFEAASGSEQPEGLKAWDTKSVQACFSVDDGPPGCFGTVFDTGAGTGSFEPPGLPPQLLHTRVRPGSAVTTSVPQAGMKNAIIAGREPWT